MFKQLCNKLYDFWFGNMIFENKTINENLFIDTETTGLPQTYGFNLFYSYKDISKYENSRITEICWSNINTTKTYVIKPDNLTEQEILDKIKLIPEHVLKLDIKEIMSGKNLKDVFIEFKNDLRKCKKIIAHNINFDINVIKNE